MAASYHSSSYPGNAIEFSGNDLIWAMKNSDTLGARLRRLRKAARLTQAALAARAGLTQGAVGNIETGERSYGGSVVAIARALRTSPEYLLLETDDPAQHATIVMMAPDQPELDLQPVQVGSTPSAVVSDTLAPLSPEAEILGRWFDRIPEDSLKKLQANQTCLQAILDALQPCLPPGHRQVQPAGAKKQSA